MEKSFKDVALYISTECSKKKDCINCDFYIDGCCTFCKIVNNGFEIGKKSIDKICDILDEKKELY